MHKTKLIEFKNKKRITLRGVFVEPKNFKKCVIFVHGFEGTSATDKKFKTLSDKLAKSNVASLRLDSEGGGLSDGDFKNMTVKNQASELKLVLKKIHTKNISIVAHSLGACVIAEYLNKNKTVFEKIVLMAPALNQKDLLKYWFVKHSHKSKKITWDNYIKYFNEKDYIKDYTRKEKMTGDNYFPTKYFLENQNKDYSESFKNNANILLVIGDDDDDVPAKSIAVDFKNKIIVKKGDHDLRRPDMEKQYLDKVLKFIK